MAGCPYGGPVHPAGDVVTVVQAARTHQHGRGLTPQYRVRVCFLGGLLVAGPRCQLSLLGRESPESVNGACWVCTIAARPRSMLVMCMQGERAGMCTAAGRSVFVLRPMKWGRECWCAGTWLGVGHNDCAWHARVFILLHAPLLCAPKACRLRGSKLHAAAEAVSARACSDSSAAARSLLSSKIQRCRHSPNVGAKSLLWV